MPKGIYIRSKACRIALSKSHLGIPGGNGKHGYYGTPTYKSWSEYNSQKHTLADWSKILNIKRSTLAQRFYCYHWSIEKTLQKGDC